MAMNRQRNLSFLFALGILSLLYGLGVCYVDSHIGKSGLLVSSIGVFCLLVCLGSWKGKSKNTGGVSRLRKYAFLSLIAAVLSIATIAVNWLVCRYDRRWDLTKAKQHTLSDYTVSLLHQLSEGMELVAFHVGLPPKYLEDMLREYERAARGKIKTSIIDPFVEIGYAAQFGHVITGEQKKVIVRSPAGRRDVDFTDSPLTEEQLTNAILRVSRETRRAYFLSGHGEYDIEDAKDNGLRTFVKLLSQNNIESRRWVSAMSGTVPEDCDVLVIAGAREHLSGKEEQAIEEYLEKGGDALFLVEHTVVTTPDRVLTEEELKKNPSLNSILTRWGLRVADDVVVDLASHASGDVGSPATRNYPSHEAIVQGLDYTFYVRPRSISILGSRRGTVKAAPLVMTASGDKSWGETNRNLMVKYDDILDRTGPVPIAFVVWEPKQNNDNSDTRLAVFTDADFLSNAFIDQYSNAEMGLNAINWLSERDYQVFIDRKDITVERLDLTSRQKRLVAVVLLAMPLLIASAGAMVCIRKG